MAGKGKESKITPVTVNNKRAWVVENGTKQDECPDKEGDNCKVPGGYSDSSPIGGG